MRATLGIVLQVAGLVELGIALYVGIVQNQVRNELLLLVVGAAFFYAGRALTK